LGWGTIESRARNKCPNAFDRNHIIVHGAIMVAADSVDELKGNDVVKRLYLGGAA
jgi:branched-chain amino acid transport system ATP-binding protein